MRSNFFFQVHYLIETFSKLKEKKISSAFVWVSVHLMTSHSAHAQELKLTTAHPLTSSILGHDDSRQIDTVLLLLLTETDPCRHINNRTTVKKSRRRARGTFHDTYVMYNSVLPFPGQEQQIWSFLKVLWPGKIFGIY